MLMTSKLFLLIQKKLSEVVGNDVVKKALLYDELVKKANAIDPRY